jgi:hypothetical protein
MHKPDAETANYRQPALRRSLSLPLVVFSDWAISWVPVSIS